MDTLINNKSCVCKTKHYAYYACKTCVCMRSVHIIRRWGDPGWNIMEQSSRTSFSEQRKMDHRSK